VKKLWDYIKSNNLQNPSNKSEILCDDKLRAVFHVDKIHMFTMNKVNTVLLQLTHVALVKSFMVKK
jgi:chromatin remodeling complex protein RSC6